MKGEFRKVKAFVEITDNFENSHLFITGYALESKISRQVNNLAIIQNQRRKEYLIKVFGTFTAEDPANELMISCVVP